jgi:glycosyltransferase involved in cell wall biosynthesis
MAWHRLRSGGREAMRYDANLMLEHVRPACLGLARRNILIPNPEWFSARDRRWLPRFDAVFTKSRIATDTFLGEGWPTHYIGFRSVDCHDASVPRTLEFLHLAGASRMKGTERLLAVWRRHPEWPLLRVLQSPQTAQLPQSVYANIDHRIDYVRDIAEVRRLQNAHIFHLCLSEAEGWGHYIAEAMSCAAVVVTCDAPPMNELVRSDRGLLVPAHEAGKLNASTRYHFDEAALETTIEHAIAMCASERETIGARARAWFLDNQRSFAARLDLALQTLL